jgi:hypothetical protein
MGGNTLFIFERLASINLNSQHWSTFLVQWIVTLKAPKQFEYLKVFWTENLFVFKNGGVDRGKHQQSS